LGGADAAITTAAKGGDAGDIVANGIAGAVVEGGATFIGGKVGEKAAGSVVKSEIVSNMTTVALTAGANAAISQTPGAVKTVAAGIVAATEMVSERIKNTGRNIVDKIEQVPEKMDPTPKIDPRRD